jgi:TetR/AcrR family transcriptional repressor of nem operon
MADLTDATKLTKGSIYGNFENKEEVALAVFDYNLNRISQVIQQRIQQAGTFREKLMIYAQVYQEFTRTRNTEGGCPILNTAIEADDTNPLLKDRAAKAVLKWKKNITDLIQGGIEAGEFKADIDQHQMAFSIIALIEGGLMISRVTNSPGNLDKVLLTVQWVIREMEV